MNRGKGKTIDEEGEKEGWLLNRVKGKTINEQGESKDDYWT